MPNGGPAYDLSDPLSEMKSTNTRLKSCFISGMKNKEDVQPDVRPPAVRNNVKNAANQKFIVSETPAEDVRLNLLNIISGDMFR